MKQKKMKKKSAAAQEIRFLGKIGFLNRAKEIRYPRNPIFGKNFSTVQKKSATQEIRFLGKIGFLNRARYFLGRLKNIRNVTIIRENDMPERVIKFISLIPLVLSLV
jgi:hypothetical protein